MTSSIKIHIPLLCVIIATCYFLNVSGFSVATRSTIRNHPVPLFTSSPSLEIDVSDTSDDDSDFIAKRIIVTGPAVQGGYYRSCVLNEARRFRKLTGTMTPPDDTDDAEIYVEGKRKSVDSFIRWCKRGNKNVGLNQITRVKEVIDEVPEGLYEDFYVKTL